MRNEFSTERRQKTTPNVPNPDKAKAMFEEAFHRFLLEERRNISDDVSERNLCARLAMYLEEIKAKFGFQAYHADPEYNRKQHGRVKTILDGEMRVIDITSDLIVHTRGQSKEHDNLIAIEMKKAGRPQQAKLEDQSRLRAMTKASFDDVWSNDGTTHPEHVCGYKLGLFIEIDTARNVVGIEEFRNGISIGAWSEDF